MWVAAACHRAPLGRKGRGQNTESRIIPASDGDRRKSQVKREPKTKEPEGHVLNGVKWGRRVGQKEKFLLDLDMRRSFVTLVKAISEMW